MVYVEGVGEMTMGDIWEDAPGFLSACIEYVLCARCPCDGKIRRFTSEAAAWRWVEAHRNHGGQT